MASNRGQPPHTILSSLLKLFCACSELWPFWVAVFLAYYTSYGNENKLLARKIHPNVPKVCAVKNIFKQNSWVLSCYSVSTQKHIVTVMMYIFTEIFPHCSSHFWSILHFINKTKGGLNTQSTQNFNSINALFLKKLVNILILCYKVSKVKTV